MRATALQAVVDMAILKQLKKQVTVEQASSSSASSSSSFATKDDINDAPNGLFDDLMAETDDDRYSAGGTCGRWSL